jgi:hypothetical protein
MTTDEIERRLRLPAPDEPALLPALYLPVQVGTAPLTARDLGLRDDRGRRPMSLVLLGAVLLLVAALAGALLTGALRLQQLRDALPIPGLYTGRGITLDYPDAWTRLTPNDPTGSSGAWVATIIGNRAVTGCEADSAAVMKGSPPPQPEPSDGVVVMGDQQGVIYHLEDRIYACLIEQPLEPGEVRIVVSLDRPQAIGVGPIGDFAGSWLTPNADTGGPVLVSAETGFTETIGEMPARLIVRDRSLVPGADQLRTWVVATPRSADVLWWIQAVIRGPDVPALEADVDAVVRTLRFDDVPAPLDAADRDAALATAIDFVDRSMRQYPGRRFLGCLPRTPGTAAATIVDGPRGRLDAPLDVTCTTTVKANDLRVWQADVEVAWPATGGHEAGRWAHQILFDSDGTVQMETDIAPGTGSPMGFPGDPSATDIPATVAAFAPGDLVRSVGAGTTTSFYDVDSSLLPPAPHLDMGPGALMVIVSGPETYDGRDFYLADGGDEIGWVGAEAKGERVLAPAELRCPTSLDATELAYLPALERHLCVSGELTLGPVQAGRLEVDPSWASVQSDPTWLAGQPEWAVYGHGVAGLDPGLPVAVAPSVGRLPTEGWLLVRGHFDDAAAASCRTTYPAEWGIPAAPREIQTRRCQERFVVTSVEPTEGP